MSTIELPTRDDLLALEDATLDRMWSRYTDPREQSLIKYCPHRPWPLQRQFLELTCPEALFGGAAGSAKTDCLLMCALQWVHVPGYSCLIIRRDFARLSKAGSIMDRLVAWLYGTDAKWNDKKKRATFPAGSLIEFGYIDHPDDRFQFQSTEYHQVIFDEVTELRLANDESNPYLFMFSRQRRAIDFPVPLMMRSASNPGQVGHAFIKDRFVPKEYNCDEYRRNKTGPIFSANGNRAFLPGFIEDNPTLDQVEYEASLMHLPQIVRSRLMRGDWSIKEDGLIEAHWTRRYTVSDDGQINYYGPDGEIAATWHESESYRFATCDPAGTSADKAKSSRGHDHSWSVIQVWERAPARVGPYLICRHVSRVRVSFTGLIETIRQVTTEWQPSRVRIENEKLGMAIQELLCNEMPIDTIPTGGKDKVSRASLLLQKMERGEVALPREASWLESLESEWYSWTGHPEEQADQVDAAAYAAIEAQGKGFGMWDASLFGPAVWVDRIPAVRRMATAIIVIDPEDSGDGLQSAIVAAGVTGDGKIYVDCWIGDVPQVELCRHIRDCDASFAHQPHGIVTTAENVDAVTDATEGLYATSTVTPVVLVANLEQCTMTKPEALSPLIQGYDLRFLRGSRGCRAMVNRMKAYPHTKDIACLVALGLAIETLTIMEV